jgi:hypothetical protein
LRVSEVMCLRLTHGLCEGEFEKLGGHNDMPPVDSGTAPNLPQML